MQARLTEFAQEILDDPVARDFGGIVNITSLEAGAGKRRM